MSKKIKVNAEKEKLRLSIPSENGTIIINEPSPKFKSDLIEKMTTIITKGEDFDEKQVMLDLINHCTNVEFDKDVFEVEYLSHEAKVITNEIILIFQEILVEVHQVIKLILQQVENEVLQGEILEEKNKIEKIADKKVEKVEDIEEIEKVEKREVRKPQRRRKK